MDASQPLPGDAEPEPARPEPSAATHSSLEQRLLEQLGAGGAAADLTAALEQLPADEASRVVERLGRRGDPLAAPLLALLAETAAAKPLRKEARRALHRLRATGAPIETPRRASTAVQPGPAAQRLTPSLARVTLSDGSGARLLWLLYDRPLGGAYGVSLVLHEILGVRDADLADTTRKRALERFAATEDQVGMQAVDLPPEYAEQLVGEADGLSRERGATLPREYQAYLRLAGPPPPAPTRALIYTALPTAETILNRGLLSETPRLLELDALKSWFFDLAPLEPFVREWRQSQSSLLVLSPQAQTERRARVTGDALRAVMTSEATRGLRRRFEEAAYVLLRLDQEREARLLVAAAEGLDGSSVSTHPLLRAMMERTLELGAGLAEHQAGASRSGAPV